MTTAMSVSTVGLSLTDFIAYELPAKKWMRLIRPTMRLRVRVQDRDFVSSPVTVDDRSVDRAHVSSVHWPWRDDERSSQPFIANDEIFEVKVERRFLFGYKCIRRTRPVTTDQVRTSGLPLYDGRLPAEMLKNRIELGKITFTLRSDASSEDAWSRIEANASTYS